MKRTTSSRTPRWQLAALAAFAATVAAAWVVLILA
jgi:hypothetical protein